MKKQLRLLFLLISILFSANVFSTHIVGGTLNYVYNGGSNYTVTLKLYRDCGPNTAQFPGTVTITVLGNNGATFSPSRDITMSLGTVTAIPSNLDTCATPPNPMPCTQEGIYTTTVNNLPPNPGGYHLYYQLIARNLSLTNVNAVCNCVGESFYAYIPGPTVVWGEDFDLANGTTVDNGPTAWSIANGPIPPNAASVNAGVFRVTGANNGQVTWTSQAINIAAFASVNLRADLFSSNNLNASDSLLVSYRINGGPLIPFTTNGLVIGNFANAVAVQNGISGNTVQIVIRARFDANSPNNQIYRFDNVIVSGTNFINNANPRFNLFPPLFLCVGQPFTFDHSATDPNGDSLFYSFYTPYNGDNGVGPLDPTFPNNTAAFTPIVFQPGYTFTNPLGIGAFNLNPTTGLLTGTPPQLGQFVVGVLVKEYRNGVFLSSTLRDFQFNVINCPQFSPAILSSQISCTGNTVSFTNLGGNSGSNWLWNFGNPAAPNATSTLYTPSYTYPGPGTYTVSLTTGFGTPCANTATAPLTIGFVTAGFTSNAPRCVASAVSFTNTSTVSSNATIVSYTWNFGDGSTSALQNPTHIYNSPGTYTVSLTTSNSINCANTFTTTVTINPFPIANANVDQTVCANNSTAVLNGIITNATGGVWSTLGSGTFAPSTSTLNATYTPSNNDINAGGVNLVLTSTGNGVCGAARDTVRIIITTAPPVANAGPDQLICGATTATLAGNSTTIGTGVWTLVSGTATITNQNSPTTTITGLLPGTSVTLRWTISSPLCLPSSDLVVINIDQLPTTANAGPNQNLCSATTTTLSANTPIVGNGQWSVVSGTAIIANPNSPTTTVSGLLPSASVTLRWTITQGLCTSASNVTISVNQNAFVNAGADQILCVPANINLNGVISGGTTTGIWSTLGSGAFTPSATSLSSTYVLSNADITNGQVTLLLTSTNNTPNCPAVIDTLSIYYAGFNGVVNSTVNNVSCFGLSNGSATVNVVGGVNPITYFWNTAPAQTTATASNLSQGNYSVTITDGNGCTNTLPINITQPQALTFNSSQTNVSCFGGSNGALSVITNGGTTPYNYLWQPGNQTTSSISNKPAGTYSLTISDANNCQINTSFTLIQPQQLIATLTANNASCNGSASGSINAIVAGGTAPYLYNWNPVSGTSPTLAGINAGTYTLTVTDFLGCQLITSANITEPTQINLTVTRTNKTCSYLNNGTATALATGGTGQYTYLWQPGSQTTSTATNLASGTYTLTLTDANGCVKFGFATITEPAPLTIGFMNQINVSCFGGSNGSATAAVTGGTLPYGYLWLPGGNTTATNTNMQSLTYSLLITDANGCQELNNAIITQPSAALSLNVTTTAASCFNTSDGSATANPSGGTPPYSYHWFPGNLLSQTINNISAGTYTVLVTDANGCTISNSSVLISQPNQLIVTTSSVNSNCGFANGTATANASGGIAPYTFQWSPSGGNNATTSGLLSGHYDVLVVDATGCGTTQYVDVNDNTGPTVTIIGTTNVSCFGGSDGSATAFVSSGSAPFNYNWLPYGGNSATASGLSAGIYTLVVQDVNGCQSLATTSPPILQPSAVAAFISTSDVLCNGGSSGSASIVASGGTPGYTYQWLPGGNTATSISNLFATTYTVNIRDANNCLLSQTFSIDQPAPVSPVIANQTNVSCFGGNNGSALISVSGGTPNYNYSWSPGGAVTPSVVGLSPGLYTVNITDQNGCVGATTLNITQPSQPLLGTTSSSAATCFGGGNGSASVIASGGTPTYTYQWSPSGGNAQFATGLSPGNYFVLVSDNNNCQTNVAVVVSSPTILSANLSVTNASCGLNNGVISSQTNGGTPPYNYLWLPSGSTNSTINGLSPGTYTLQVRDAQNCLTTQIASITNISGPNVSIASQNNVSCNAGANGFASIQVSQGTAPYTINWQPYGGNGLLATNLSVGTYTVTVTDALGCQTPATVTLSQPSPLSINISAISPVSCFGGSNGSVTVNATGGTPSYNYSWSPIISNQQTLSNLSAGIYVVTVLDQNSCQSATSINITQPTPLNSATTTSTNPVCFGGFGSASVVGVGGTVPFTYLWGTTPQQSGSTVNNLVAGTTSYTVTDANGCKFENTVVLTQPSQVVTTAGSNVSICAGQIATLTASASGGGVGNYNYTWQPSGIVNNGNLSVSPPITTTYTVTAFDQNGCTGSSAQVTCFIYTLTNAQVTISGNPLICPGQSVILAAQTTGVTGPLTYSWSNGLGNTAGPFIVTPTQPTTYSVTVTNSCGSSVVATLLVDFNPPPIVLFTSNLISFCVPRYVQFNDNSISGNANDPINNWLWNFGDGTFSTQQNPLHLYTLAGTYSVTLTVTTVNGCNNINNNTPYIINAYATPNASFSVNSYNLNLPYDQLICTNQSSNAVSYSWSFGDGGTSSATNPQYLYQTVGNYQVQLIATSSNGCSDTAYQQINTNADITFPNVFTPNTDGSSGGYYNINALDNDIFFPYTSGVVEYSLQIFNRWGELIFETDDIKQGWDGYYKGKLCQSDVYIWKAAIKLNNGKKFNKSGDVTLLR